MDPFNTAQTTAASNFPQATFAAVQGPQNFRESPSFQAPTGENQFTVDVPDEIDGQALTTGATPEDVFSARNEAEQSLVTAPDPLQPARDIADTPVEASRFDNYDDVIFNALYGDEEPTEAEQTQQEILNNFAERTAAIAV